MNSLQVLIPSDNIEERSYIIEVIIKDFLGLSYELILMQEIQDYILIRENKKIIIKDAFFSNYKETLSYLHLESLPKSPSWFTQLDEKIPIIYGDNILRIGEDEIFCGLDIFSSSFFMLSRWEEYVIKEKDILGRCNEAAMFATRNNLINHPFVCKYIAILKKMLLQHYPELIFKNLRYSSLITHDVDYLFRFGSVFSLGQNLVGDILHRKSLFIALKTISDYMRFKTGKINDPFDTFDELMDLSEAHGFKSSFYFKPSIQGEPDFSYNIFDKRVIELINRIYKRGHEVGIHPSINTFHDEEQYQLEVQRIRSIGIPICGGRQHYLLYDISETFRFWEKAGMDYDCGLGFNRNIGFRCGVCWPFRVFDIVQRKILKLVEKPLCVMEAAVLPSQPHPETLFEKIQDIIIEVKKNSGQFVFLWHNDGFHRPENLKYAEVYLKVLKSI